jgi:hypothetical protein
VAEGVDVLLPVVRLPGVVGFCQPPFRKNKLSEKKLIFRTILGFWTIFGFRTIFGHVFEHIFGHLIAYLFGFLNFEELFCPQLHFQFCEIDGRN